MNKRTFKGKIGARRPLVTVSMFALGALLSSSLSAFAVTWNIFGDVDAIKSGQGSPTQGIVGNSIPASSKTGAFSLGELSLHMSGNITDRVTGLVEAVIGPNPDQSQSIETERYQLTYLFSDLFKLTAGRFHNALGHYNMDFHHGRILQTTIDRPLFLRFEDSGGSLPTHLVGLWGDGRYESPYGALQYDLMVGNGPVVGGIGTPGASLLPNRFQDDNTNKSVTARLTYYPPLVPDLGIGAYEMNNKVNGYNAADTPLEQMSVSQNIYGVDTFYTGKRLEVFSELYRFDDKDDWALSPTFGERFGASAYFVQTAYLIPHSPFKPYLRYEGLDRTDTDPYFSSFASPSYHRFVYGVRYNMNLRTAIKLEGRSMHEAGRPEYQEVALQWAFIL